MDENNASNQGNHKRTDSKRSFLSSLFQRSISVSESETDNADMTSTRSIRRTRSQSESTNIKIPDGDDGCEDMRDAIMETDRSMEPLSTRIRSLTLSSLLLGRRMSVDNDINSYPRGREAPPATTACSPPPLFDEMNYDSAHSSETLETKIISSDSKKQLDNEVSQNDRLNKKLLTSFLERINSVAETIIDPSGTGDTVGKIYTDDVMMDRILRRVDSHPPD